MEVTRKRNQATKIVFPLINASSTSAYYTTSAWTSMTNATKTVYFWSDDASAPTSATIAANPTQLASTGEWYLVISASEISAASQYMSIKLKSDQILEQTILVRITNYDASNVFTSSDLINGNATSVTVSAYQNFPQVSVSAQTNHPTVAVSAYSNFPQVYVSANGDKTGYSITANTDKTNYTVSSGSITAVAGNVTGSVGSVTGAVGSVTGNVGGNVVGSVASVTNPVSVSATTVALSANLIQWLGATPNTIDTNGNVRVVINKGITSGDFEADYWNRLGIGTPVALNGGTATIAGMLQQIADGSTGSTFVSANSLKGIYNQIITNNASSLTANGGSVIGGANLSGSYLNTSAADSNYWKIQTSGTVPLSATLTFNLGTRVPSTVSIVGYLQAGAPTNAGIVNVYAYNYTTSGYDLLTNASTAILNGAVNSTYSYVLNSTTQVNSVGAAQILFVAGRLNTNDILNIDYVVINAVAAGTSVTDIANAVYNKMGLVVYDNGIWIDTINGFSGTTLGVNGISTYPSNNLANALNIAQQINLKRFYLKPDSQITLVSAYDAWRFIGRAIIGLNGQSIADTVFENSEWISGTSVGQDYVMDDCALGNVTLDSGNIHNSEFNGTFTTCANGVYVFKRCIDANPAGLTSPTFVCAPSATMAFRDWRGGIQFNNMVSSNSIKLDGMGRVVIDSSCSGGDLTLRGFWQVTNNGTGVIITSSARYDNTTPVTVSAYQNFPQVFVSAGTVNNITNSVSVSAQTNHPAVSVSAYTNFPQVQVSGINGGLFVGTSAYTNFPQVFVSAGTITTVTNITNPVSVSAYTNFPQVTVSANLDKINYTVSSGSITAVSGNITGSVASVTNPVTVGTNNDKTGYTVTAGTIGNITNPVSVSAYTNFPQVQVSGINGGLFVGTSAYSNFPQVTVSANLDKQNYTISAWTNGFNPTSAIGTPSALDGSPATLFGNLKWLADGGKGTFTSANSIVDIYNSILAVNPTAFVAYSGTTNNGNNISGSYVQTQSLGTTYWQITNSGTSGLDARLYFNTNSNNYKPIQLKVTGRYQVSNPVGTKAVDVYVYNYTLSAWNQLSNAGSRINGTTATTDNTYTYTLSQQQISNNGLAIVRFVSNETSTTATTEGLFLSLSQYLAQTGGLTLTDISNAVWTQSLQQYEGAWQAGSIVGHSIAFNGVITSAISNLKFQINTLPTSASLYNNYFISVRNASTGITETRTIQTMDANGIITLMSPLSISPNVSDFVQITTINNMLNLFEGTVISATSTTVTIDNSPTLIDDFYTYCHISIVDGLGKGQDRQILVYTSADATCYIDRPWRIVPDNTSTFSIHDYHRELHVQSTGLVTSATSATITLKATENSANDFYARMGIVIRGGTGTGQARHITSYNGTTKVATIDYPWVVTPTANSVYAIMSPDTFSTSSDFSTEFYNKISELQPTVVSVSAYNNFPSVNVSGGTITNVTNPVVVSAYQNFPQVQVSGINGAVGVASATQVTNVQNTVNAISAVTNQFTFSGSNVNAYSTNELTIGSVTVSAYQNFPQVQVSGINTGVFGSVSAFTNFPQVYVSAGTINTLTNPVTVSAYQNFPQVQVSGFTSGISVSANITIDYNEIKNANISAIDERFIFSGTSVEAYSINELILPNAVTVSAYQNFPQVTVSANLDKTNYTVSSGTINNLTNPAIVSAYQNFPQVTVSANLDKTNYTVSSGTINTLTNPVTVSAYQNFPNVEVSAITDGIITSSDFQSDYWDRVQLGLATTSQLASSALQIINEINQNETKIDNVQNTVNQISANTNSISGLATSTQLSNVQNTANTISAVTNQFTFNGSAVNAYSTNELIMPEAVTVSAYQNFPQVLVSGFTSGISVSANVTIDYEQIKNANLSAIDERFTFSGSSVEAYSTNELVFPNAVTVSAYQNFPEVQVSGINNGVYGSVSAFMNVPQVTVSANLDKTNYTVSSGIIDTVNNSITISAYQNFPEVQVSAINSGVTVSAELNYNSIKEANISAIDERFTFSGSNVNAYSVNEIIIGDMVVSALEPNAIAQIQNGLASASDLTIVQNSVYGVSSDIQSLRNHGDQYWAASAVEIQLSGDISAACVQAIQDQFTFSGSSVLAYAIGGSVSADTTSIVNAILTSTIDTKTFAEIMEILLSMANGRITRSNNLFTYYKQDNNTQLFTLESERSERIRL